MARRELYIQGKGVVPVVKALSNDARLEILDYCEEEIRVQTLTERMGLSKTAVLAHIKILEEAGFVKTRYIPGAVGNQKVCKKMYDRLIFDFASIPSGDGLNYYETITQPGNYFDYNLYPPCGLATTEHVISKWDDPSVFMLPERVEASILWCVYGYVEYRIPLNIPFEDYGISKIEIIMEVSAQGGVSEHRSLFLPPEVDKARITDGVSDVFFEVDGYDLGTITVEEFSRISGGKYTPTWWKGSNYGKLVSIVINGKGTTINGIKTSDVRVEDIISPNVIARDNQLKKALLSSDSIRLRIGIREDAEHISGFNLFGHGFGQHTCDIITRFYMNDVLRAGFS